MTVAVLVDDVARPNPIATIVPAHLCQRTIACGTSASTVTRANPISTSQPARRTGRLSRPRPGCMPRGQLALRLEEAIDLLEELTELRARWPHRRPTVVLAEREDDPMEGMELLGESAQQHPSRHTYRPPESFTTSTAGGSPEASFEDSRSRGPPTKMTRRLVVTRWEYPPGREGCCERHTAGRGLVAGV